MKCEICDKQLSEKEINYNDVTKEFEPCTTCIEVIMDAAYSDGVQPEDDEFIVLEDFDEKTEYQYSMLNSFSCARDYEDD